MDSYNEYLVKCWTCNDLLSCFSDDYEAMVANGMTTEEALNSLGVTEPCCRALMLNPTVVTFNMENREVINGLKSVDAANYPDPRPVKGSDPIFTHCRKIAYSDETLLAEKEAEANRDLLLAVAPEPVARKPVQAIAVQPTLKVTNLAVPTPKVTTPVAPVPKVASPPVLVPPPPVTAVKIAVPPPVLVPPPPVTAVKIAVPPPPVLAVKVAVPPPPVLAVKVAVPPPTSTKAGPLTRPLTITTGVTAAPPSVKIAAPRQQAPITINPIVLQGLTSMVPGLRPIDMDQTEEGIEVEVQPHQFKWPAIVGIPTINETRTLDRELVDVGVGKHTYILTGRTYWAG